MKRAVAGGDPVGAVHHQVVEPEVGLDCARPFTFDPSEREPRRPLLVEQVGQHRFHSATGENRGDAAGRDHLAQACARTGRIERHVNAIDLADSEERGEGHRRFRHQDGNRLALSAAGLAQHPREAIRHGLELTVREPRAAAYNGGRIRSCVRLRRHPAVQQLRRHRRTPIEHTSTPRSTPVISSCCRLGEGRV
jgi:hypothetical protein